MRKIICGLSGLVGLLASQAALAGSPLGGSSTFTLSWTSGATAVPTLGLYGTVALALLVMVVLLRVLRDKPAILRTLAPVAGLGLTLGAGLWVQDITAGVAPSIGASSCSGSQTYTAEVERRNPPCFVNTCGAPVTVSYTFVSGVDFAGDPLTAEGCTLEYACFDADEGPVSVRKAVDGSLIPSDGLPYGTAVCLEIIDPELMVDQA